MAVARSGATTDLWTIDPTFKAARMTARPAEYRGAGHFRMAVSSGLTVSLLAGSDVFACRWAFPDADMILWKLSAYYVATVAFTAVGELGLSFNLVENWTTAPSAGTTVLPGIGQKANGRQIASLFTSSVTTNIRISATGAVTSGASPVGQQIMRSSNIGHDLNALAGTAQLLAAPRPGFTWSAKDDNAGHPLTFRTGEGFIIENTTAFGAAGTARLWVEMVWAEVYNQVSDWKG